MFNGIFNQFLDQSVENPPKIVGGANRQTEPNRKIRPLWGGFGIYYSLWEFY
jgi:hypothetical protein